MNNEILKFDKDFTESNFKTFVDNVFIQIHLAIMTKTLLNVKHFMSDDVYNKFSDKVKTLENQGLIQMYDEINVKSTEIVEVRIEDIQISIVVRIISRYMDYLLDENGNYISGNNTSRIEKENFLTFVKKKDALGLADVRKCPGCGAPIDVNANGLCAYCNSTFDLETRDWFLVQIETR